MGACVPLLAAGHRPHSSARRQQEQDALVWRMRNGIIFTLDAADRRRRVAPAADCNIPRQQVRRARIVLLSANGVGTHATLAE
jgi:hypothetical protein